MKAKNESLFTELTINESANVNGGYGLDCQFIIDDTWINNTWNLNDFIENESRINAWLGSEFFDNTDWFSWY